MMHPASQPVTLERARLHRQMQSPTHWQTVPPARDTDVLMQALRQQQPGGQQTRASNAIRTLQLIAHGKLHMPAPAWIPSPGRKDWSDPRDLPLDRGTSQSPVMGLEGRAMRGSGSWQQMVQQQNRAGFAGARQSWHAGSPIRMPQRRASHRDRASDTWRTGSNPSSPFPGASPRSPLGSPLNTRVHRSPHADAHGSRDWNRISSVQRGASKDWARGKPAGASSPAGGAGGPGGTEGAGGRDSPASRKDIALKDFFAAQGASDAAGAAHRDVLHPRVAKIRQLNGSVRKGPPAAASGGGRMTGQ